MVKAGKLDESYVPHIKKGIEDQGVYVKCLATCAAMSLADPTGFAAEVPTMIARETFITGMCLHDLAYLKWRRALTHLAMLSLGWIPKIGGICYLLPVILNDAKTGLFLTYHLSQCVTKRYPDKIMHFVGSIFPARTAVWLSDKLRLSNRSFKGYDLKEGRGFSGPKYFYNMIIKPFLDGARGKELA